MTSPALSPALAATESAATDFTSTPSLTPKYSASWMSRSSIVTPRRPLFRRRNTSSSIPGAATAGRRGARGVAGARGGNGGGGGGAGRGPRPSKNRLVKAVAADEESGGV